MAMTTNLAENRSQRLCLEKNEYTDTRLYSIDSSSLFNLGYGTVTIHISLPRRICNGVYAACDPTKYFSDYLLFAISPVGQYVSNPGIYAAFTHEGIEFTLWNSNGRFKILDTTTTIESNTPFIIDFCWDWSSKNIGAGAKVAIAVDDVITASCNYPIYADDLDDVEFTVLDNSEMDYQTNSKLFDLVTYSNVPMRLRNKAIHLTKAYLGNKYVVACGRDSIRIFTDNWTDTPIDVGLGSATSLKTSLACCDTSGDIYLISSYGSSDGSISRFSSSSGIITDIYGGFSNPKCLAITQLDGMDYPRIYDTVPRYCKYVWVGDGSDLYLFDSDLNLKKKVSTYSNIVKILPTSDGRAWIIDRGLESVTLVEEDTLNVLESIPVAEPENGVVNLRNEIFIYDAKNSRIRKFFEGVQQTSIIVSSDIVDFDVNPNTGKIVVIYDDGTVSILSRNLSPITSWLLNTCSAVSVGRGYLRDSIFLVDDQDKALYEYDFSGSQIRSTFLDYPLFNGSLSSIAYNNTTLEANAEKSGTAQSTDSSIYNVMVKQFNVDTIDVDLSGNRENSEDGVQSSDIPTDLQEGVLRGARLPE